MTTRLAHRPAAQPRRRLPRRAPLRRALVAAVAAVTAVLAGTGTLVPAPAHSAVTAGLPASAPGISPAAVPAAVPAGSTSCGADIGTKVPIVLVHGFTSSASTWDRSVDRLDADPRTCVVPFDYATTATQWVDNPNNAPRLARTIRDLADMSRAGGGAGKVIVVAHSLGGLLTRCAASSSCVGNDAIGDALLDVITFGTPLHGTFLKGNGLSWIVDVAPILQHNASVKQRVLAYLSCQVPLIDGLCAEVRALETSPAAAAFTPGSGQLKALPQSWPRGVPSFAVAGSLKLQVQVFLYHQTLADIGDAVVSGESALAGKAFANGLGGEKVIDCGAVGVTFTGTFSSSTLTPLLALKCWHGQETYNDDFVAAARGEIVRALATLPAPVSKDPRSWAISPGQIGPVKVGMTGQQLAAMGYAVPSTAAIACGVTWSESKALSDAGIHFEFRYGASPDDLDQITVQADKRPVAFGVGLGSTANQLRAAYGSRMQEAVLDGAEDGRNVMGIVFGPNGALLYYLQSVTYSSPPTTPVTVLQLTRGTTVGNVGFLGSGC